MKFSNPKYIFIYYIKRFILTVLYTLITVAIVALMSRAIVFGIILLFISIYLLYYTDKL